MPDVERLPGRRVRFLTQTADSQEQHRPAACAGERRVKILAPSTPVALRSALALAPAMPDGRAFAPELIYSLPSGIQIHKTFCGRVCSDLVRHCMQSRQHGAEVGGLLAGYCYRRVNQSGRISYHVLVTDAIPVDSGDASRSHLTFDSACWDRIDAAMQRSFAPEGKLRVGWYHTHPNQGIFFSRYDRDAHAVFRLEHQSALVVDPRSMQAGLFYWADHAERRLAGPLLFSLTAAGPVPQPAASGGLVIRLSPEATSIVEFFRSNSRLWCGALAGAAAALVAAAVLPPVNLSRSSRLSREQPPPKASHPVENEQR